MTAYVDASVILRLLLFQSQRLEAWGDITRPVTSRLAESECLRALDALRLDRQLDDLALARSRRALDELLQQFHFVEVSRGILTRAGGPMPTRLKTLDALHLASALQWQASRKEPIVMATHDRRLALAASASGLAVLGVDIPGVGIRPGAASITARNSA